MSRPQTLSDIIFDILTTKFDLPEEITSDARFEDLDLDSLVLTELSVRLTSRFGLQLTEDEIHAAGTVEGIAQLLASRGARV